MAFTGVKVFSATKAKDREELGEHITRWIGGKMYTQEMLADPKVLATFGLNPREIKFLKDKPFPELAALFRLRRRHRRRPGRARF